MRLSCLYLAAFLLACSCNQEIADEQSSPHNDSLLAVSAQVYKGVDRVTAYLEDHTDTTRGREQLIYQVAWGNTPDSLKPQFGLAFWKKESGLPGYIPGDSCLTGKPGETLTYTSDKQLPSTQQTGHTMKYDPLGRIEQYSMIGPSHSFFSLFEYNKENQLVKIIIHDRMALQLLRIPGATAPQDGQGIEIVYNSAGNVEKIRRTNADKSLLEELRIFYTYVALPRPNVK